MNERHGYISPDSPEAKAFIADIAKVCRDHGLKIGKSLHVRGLIISCYEDTRDIYCKCKECEEWPGSDYIFDGISPDGVWDE